MENETSTRSDALARSSGGMPVASPEVEAREVVGTRAASRSEDVEPCVFIDFTEQQGGRAGC